MKRTIRFGFFASLTILILTGCATSQGDSCKAMVEKESTFKGNGFEIPLGKFSDMPIKIGSLEYVGPQAKALSDAAQKMQEIRLSNCAVLASKIPEAGAIVMKGYEIMLAFGNSLSGAQTPAEGAKAAEKAARDAEQLLKDSKGKTASADTLETSPPQQQPLVAKNPLTPDDLEIWSRLAEVTANSKEQASRIVLIQESIKTMADSIGSLRNESKSSLIEIAEFNVNSTSIPADAREQLARKFRNALDAIPDGQRIKVLIVGYSDNTGTYLGNLDLSLRRAESVYSLLQYQRHNRTFEGRILSGGVSKSVLGRHVAIYVAGYA
jgi:outer membrane protein OmpA-like peptidoglycan-associated protein